MVEKQLKDITISDLLNKYIFVEGDLGNSADVYNDNSNYMVTFVENTSEESALSASGVTKVYDAVKIALKDVTGTASADIKKGTVIARLEKNSDALKNIVKVSVRTDINNTYNIPVRPSDAYVAINQEHYTGEEGIALLLGVSESAKSFNDIVNFNPSLELLDADELLKNLKDMTPAKAATLTTTADKGSSYSSSSSSIVGTGSDSKETTPSTSGSEAGK